MTKEYEDKFGQGTEYQDFVTHTLYHLGQALVPCSSFRYQIEIGENMIGWEIKNVKTMKQYNALYIEIMEKSDPSNPDYVPSGIMREDNTIFMVMGDYDTFYVIQKKRLKDMYTSGVYLKHGCWDIPPTPTSIGWALPLAWAEKIKVFKVVVEDGKAKIIT